MDSSPEIELGTRSNALFPAEEQNMLKKTSVLKAEDFENNNEESSYFRRLTQNVSCKRLLGLDSSEDCKSAQSVSSSHYLYLHLRPHQQLVVCVCVICYSVLINSIYTNSISPVHSVCIPPLHSVLATHGM